MTPTNSWAALPGSDPKELSIHPSGAFAYIPDFNADQVYIYTLNQITGASAAAVPASGANGAGTGPTSVAIHPNGNFLYVMENGTGKITTYAINTTTGALSATGNNHTPGAGILKGVVSPNGKWLYVAGDTDVHIYSINEGTGAITFAQSIFVIDPQATPEGVYADNNSKFLYVTCMPEGEEGRIKVYSINQTTGALSLVQTISPEYATYYTEGNASENGRFFFMIDYMSSILFSFSVAPSTGQITMKQKQDIPNHNGLPDASSVTSIRIF